MAIRVDGPDAGGAADEVDVPAPLGPEQAQGVCIAFAVYLGGKFHLP